MACRVNWPWGSWRLTWGLSMFRVQDLGCRVFLGVDMGFISGLGFSWRFILGLHRV